VSLGINRGLIVRLSIGSGTYLMTSSQPSLGAATEFPHRVRTISKETLDSMNLQSSVAVTAMLAAHPTVAQDHRFESRNDKNRCDACVPLERDTTS
jgi:hypothetical protein